MVDPRAKGARGETTVRDVLRTLTGLHWERTPGSGALDQKHGLKGDLYIPNAKNVFCVEVKNYEEDQLSSTILHSKNPLLLEWWDQAVRQGQQVQRKPLLIYKFNRSKIYVAYQDVPSTDIKSLLVLDKFFISLLEDWINLEKPKFVE